MCVQDTGHTLWFGPGPQHTFFPYPHLFPTETKNVSRSRQNKFPENKVFRSFKVLCLYMVSLYLFSIIVLYGCFVGFI